jgi:hypothetical protein
MLVHRPARFFCVLLRSSALFCHESDKNRARGAELDMTTCRTHESGGTPGRRARPAELTRTGSGASRAASPPERTRRALAAARRAQPPDLALLRRVRDGLNRL